MSAPITTVEVVFDETTLDATAGFKLDDTARGVLNNPYYLLDGGLTFADVSADVQQVTVSRGRSRQLDEYSSGSANINFISTTRKYDPLNQSSPYYPYVIPRRYVRIKSNGVAVFAGMINTWSLSYDLSGVTYMTAQCSDAFALLANQLLTAYTPDAELTGTRISNIFGRPEINFNTTSISIDAGTETLGAFPIDADTAALGYLRQVEKSEQGYLFATADNTFKFKDRSTVLAQTGNVSFKDDGTGTSGYMTLDVETGDELLFNRIIAQSPAGVAQIATDATSIATYDTSTLDATDLLNNTTANVAAIADLLLQQYKNPEVRFTGVSQQLSALSGANQNLLLGLDLTDLATVTKTYATGSPATITKYVLVEGITHTITPENHMIGFRFASLSQIGFILNSGVFGLLDVGSIN